MRFRPRAWWLWYALWRACMFIARDIGSSSLYWFDWAARAARRCRAAGGPRVTGIIRYDDDPKV